MASALALAASGCDGRGADAPAVAVTRPAVSGYHGSLPLLKAGPGAILWSNGKLGTGEGAPVGELKVLGSDRLTRVVRAPGGWLACGVGRLKGDPTQVLGNTGALTCLHLADGRIRRLVFPATVGLVYDVSLAGDRLRVLASSGGRLLLVERPLGGGEVRRRLLPDADDMAPPYFIDANRIGRLIRTGSGCIWRTLAVGEEAAANPLAKSLTGLPACGFHRRELLADVADGARYWLLAASEGAWLVSLSPVGDPRVLPVRLPASVAQITDGPLLVAEGRLYYSDRGAGGVPVIAQLSLAGGPPQQMELRRTASPGHDIVGFFVSPSNDGGVSVSAITTGAGSLQTHDLE